MHAYVYKSRRRADTYLYLACRDGFDRLPAALRQALEPFQHVLDVALTPRRTLAREDPQTVRANLARQGYHLQWPPAGRLPEGRGYDGDA